MENFASFLLPALLGFCMLRVFYTPVKWLLHLFVHGSCGFLCLWILNAVSGVTGLTLPVNAATILLCGMLGIPGTTLVVLLEILPV